MLLFRSVSYYLRFSGCHSDVPKSDESILILILQINAWIRIVVRTALVVFFRLCVLLRGTIVNRTYGTHKNLPGIYFAISTIKILVLFTMVPRNSVMYQAGSYANFFK